MMGWTDRHFRYLMRLLGGDAFLLFSEMITVQAIHYGDGDIYLQKNDSEGDVILQIGGSCEKLIAEAITRAEKYDYSGYNLNVGCPSDRVQKGKIGAILMKEPHLVARLLRVMQDNTDRPVSIKTRVGVDGVDSYDYFKNFVDVVCESGVTDWIVHARDAWLKGLSPRQNRSVPPLRYDYVYRLKQEMPHLSVALNGGLNDELVIREALGKVDAVMLGRAAYQNPRLIHALGCSNLQYNVAIEKYLEYVQYNIGNFPIRRMLAPLVIALTGYHGAKSDRTIIAACKDDVEAQGILSDFAERLQDVE